LGLVITFALIYLHLAYSLPGMLNPQWSTKPFAERILKQMEVGGELKICFFQSSGLIYYTRKPSIEMVRSESRFWEVFHSPKRFFFVIKTEDFERLKGKSRAEVSLIEQTRVGDRNLLLISNQ
jgi:hypothetical protein